MMFAHTLPAGVTTSAQPAGTMCSGRKKDGGPCRAITRLTVVVAGTPYVACDHHTAQVADRELELIARREAPPAETPANARVRQIGNGDHWVVYTDEAGLETHINFGNDETLARRKADGLNRARPETPGH